MDEFDGFFRRADLDDDGRISGAEAVAFFQGSNLPKPVLAQIWKYADENRAGFLSRQEFYNALKLVTVAQSKKELRADIVKAALYGPASTLIPAPQINLVASSSLTKTPSRGSVGGDVLSSPIPTHIPHVASFTRQPTRAPPVQSAMPSVPRPNQQGSTQNMTCGSSQPQWPKMTRDGVNKYIKVFMEVDFDRDGKITGEQARTLFLSWRLPRDILKKVWDLSDEDNDSMLSLREFCIALYLMERYREGRNLPPTLPRNVLLDETLLSLTTPRIPLTSEPRDPLKINPLGALNQVDNFTINAAISVINRMVNKGLMIKGNELWCFAMCLFEDVVKRELFLSLPDDDGRMAWLEYKQNLDD